MIAAAGDKIRLVRSNPIRINKLTSNTGNYYRHSITPKKTVTLLDLNLNLRR